MCKLISLLLTLLALSSAQKYPACPQNIPIDTGNTTEAFYLKLITLTTFIDYQDDGSLQNAFYLYAKTGDQTQVEAILMNSKKFFLVIIAVISTVALSLLLVVNRMGDLQLTTKAVFDKLKQRGFSSALSAFYAFITIVLLASTCINVYEIQQMFGKLQMTSCRIDALNEAFLRGAIDYDWDGVTGFSQKLANYSEFSSRMAAVVNSSYTDKSALIYYAQTYFTSLWQSYLAIVTTYNLAYIGDINNPSKRINLATLVPNLFTNTSEAALLSPLTDYLSLLNSTLKTSVQLQNALNNTAEVLSSWSNILSSTGQSLANSTLDFSSDYIKLRQSLDQSLSQGKSLLIVCEVISGLTLFCTMVGLFSLKLIQSNYDYFSLSSYKIMWTFHVFMLATNLVFLMLVNQTFVYNKGMCLLADQLVDNQTSVEDVFPKTQATSGLYYLYSCYQSADFGEITKTGQMTEVLAGLIEIRENLTTAYSVQRVGYYSDVLQSIRDTLTPYQLGIKGNISFIDAQLEAINAITSSNFQNEGCYKHHWVYGPSNCSASQVGIIKPQSITFLNNTSNYDSQPSMCYLLTDYTSNSPTAINTSSLYQLYGAYNSKCPQSNAALAIPINQFLRYFESRRCIFGSLIDSIYNLTAELNSTTKYIVSYIAVRQPLLRDVASGFAGFNLSQLSSGQNCGVVREILKGVYNDFCINFGGSLRSIYLLAMCNIVYILFMIIFSLLYAIELRNVLKKDLDDPYSDLQFLHTVQMMSSQSVSVISAISADDRQSDNSKDELPHSLKHPKRRFEGQTEMVRELQSDAQSEIQSKTHLN